jgi:NADPH:quinone reductase-like Zn-dependent oxidoreductase
MLFARVQSGLGCGAMTMKAVVCHEYGSPDVLKFEEIDEPIPKDNEILIRIYATAVNIGDLWARNFKSIAPSKFTMPVPLWLLSRLYFGFTKPRVKILGSEFAGEVAGLGKAANRFKVGDQVFGYRGQSMGANAEYLRMEESGLVALKPANMSYEQAAAVPYGALIALSLLRHVELRSGQKVLINGASGAIGSAVVQLAKHFGAEVTGVGGTPRLELIKTLGADNVLDYNKDDFSRNVAAYDLIFDVLGKSEFSRCKKSLKKDGTYLLASFKMKQLLQMLWTKIAGGKRVVCALAAEDPQDLVLIKELVEAGRYTSVIDRCYPLERAAEAHRYVESGFKKGSVVLVMNATRQ